MWRKLHPVGKTFLLLRARLLNEGNSALAQTNGMWSARLGELAAELPSRPEVACPLWTEPW